MRALTTTVLVIAMAALAACGGSDGGDGIGSTGEHVDIGGWGGVINPDGDPVRGGTLRIDQSAAPPGISSLYFMTEPNNPTAQVVMLVFDQLIEFKPGKVDPSPGLAESWEFSEDGLTLTFKLRTAQFSNGMPVTSADVKWVLDRARGPKSFAADLFKPIKTIDTPDESTVVLRLAHPAKGLLFNLATAGVSIVPAKVVKQVGLDAFNRNPVGSGPFMVKRWKRDQTIELVRNAKYWRKGLPYLDAVKLVPTPNDNTRVLNIDSGTTDVADYIPFSAVKRIDKGGSARVLIAPGGDMNVVWMNNSKKPFDEVAVRQALNYATPVKSIIDVVFDGLAPRMNTVIPKVKFWTDKAKAYPYDIDKAKELLKKSSVPNGFSTTLMITGTDQASKQMAEIMRQSWKEIGVDAKIQAVEEAIRGDRYAAGDYDLTLARPGEFTTDVPVDDQFAELLFDSPETNNLFTWYKNPKTEQLAQEAMVETDEAKRRELFGQMHVESMKDPPVVPIVYTPNRAAVRNDVHGFAYMLGGFWRLESTWKE